MELENYFKVYNNILPKKFCDEVVSYAKQFSLEKGRTFLDQYNKSKQSDSIRKSNVKFFKDPWIINELRGVLAIANQEANWNYEYSINEDVQFTEYKKGQFYDFHPDSSPIPHKEGPLKGLIRKLSMSINLTNRNNYSGGEFLFRVPDGHGNYETITPAEFGEKGSIVVFPSYVIHTVKPVTKGTRHSLVMWTNGKPFI